MLNNPLMPSLSLYDPFVEALNRGVKVMFGALDHRYTSTLAPSHNVIIVAPRLPDAMSRYAVAHQLMHLEIDALSGLLGPAIGRDEARVELMVCNAIARTLLPANQLRKALMESDQAEDVAELLEVPVTVLARRLRELTPYEVNDLLPMIGRLSWPSHWGHHTFVCGRFDGTAHNAAVNRAHIEGRLRSIDDPGTGELALGGMQ
jgi:hypothetical protein